MQWKDILNDREKKQKSNPLYYSFNQLCFSLLPAFVSKIQEPPAPFLIPSWHYSSPTHLNTLPASCSAHVFCLSICLPLRTVCKDFTRSYIQVPLASASWVSLKMQVIRVCNGNLEPPSAPRRTAPVQFQFTALPTLLRRFWFLTNWPKSTVVPRKLAESTQGRKFRQVQKEIVIGIWV